jgi:hypothetical protein
VVGDVPQGDMDSIVGVKRRSGAITILHLPGHLGLPFADVNPGGLRLGRIRMVRVAKGEELRGTWNNAIRTQRPGGTRVVLGR